MTKRGAVTFVFDDGYQHVLDDVVPLLEQHEMHGVFAVPLDPTAVEITEDVPVATVQSWQSAARRGHELAAHSISHVDLTTLDGIDLIQELAVPADVLEAETLVYPGGAHNDDVRREAATHYRSARTVEWGMESLPPRDPMQLRSFNFTRRNFSVWRANLLVLLAWVTNRWLIETYHVVDGDSRAVHSVALADLTRHLAFVKRLGIPVRTIREVMSNA